MASVELGYTAIAMQPDAADEAHMQPSTAPTASSLPRPLPVQPPAKPKHVDTKAKRQLGMRSWLKVDTSGEIQFVLLDKHKVVTEYGVQLRDLRILDPNLATSYPSAILCREKALIVNIEHIRLIITPESVMVRNAEDAPVTQFVEMLKGRLAQQPAAWNASMGNLNVSPTSLGNTHMSMPNLGLPKEEADRNGARAIQELRVFSQQFPFELRALEVCLEQVAQMLDTDSLQLEVAAHHALEHLTKKVTAHNLERVRKIKTRMVRLSTKVETIREVLEKLLDDDKDMLSMNLSAKIGGTPMLGGTPTAPFEVAKSSASSDSSDSDYDDDEIAKVEMLLEPYFMQVDNTFNRLQGLKEYIDDTEVLINIKSDQHRNRLFGIDMLFTFAMVLMAFITALTGIFSVNLVSGVETSHTLFMVVALGSSGFSITAFAVFVYVSHRKELLNFW